MLIRDTSTDWILLVSKVDWLQTEFEWVVGGIGVAIAVVAIAVGLVHFYYTRHIQRLDAEKIRNDINSEFSKRIDGYADDLRAYVDQTVQSTSDKLRSEFDSKLVELDQRAKYLENLISTTSDRVQADVDRIYALYCENQSQYENSFQWWLSAATRYEFIDMEIFTTCIDRALLAIDKSGNQSLLMHRADTCKTYIEQIRVNHESIAATLTEKLNSKLPRG